MKFDIVVIGGGHAGIEAAAIAARRDLSVLLITTHLDLIGQMSCNPSIGGVAKGTIVREIDALGGLMGRLIDNTGIHFRMLNASKGMAVWGNRAQADKVAYRREARRVLESQERISLLQGFVVGLRIRGEAVCGIELDSGEVIEATAVILAMGTFLNGVAHIGLQAFPAGRLGEPPSLGLTQSLSAMGISSARLKTGTSPRIDARSVDFSAMMAQPGDVAPWRFSYMTEKQLRNQVQCWITRTSAATHAIIRENLDRSPLYTGKIKSIGPRYCPSIEDKVVRFGERQGHTLFLEPESVDGSELYLNGLSTSLPFDVQLRMVRSVRGLENAQVVRPGYGIEYDYFPPEQLEPTLESKVVRKLFFAGQINGTSGYEEAACQGIVAGINAAAAVLSDDRFVPSRDASYIGVLIDDLVTKGTREPYRMFTSRAEYRLLLRYDNADQRLMPFAHRLGLLDVRTYEAALRRWEEKRRRMDLFANRRIDPQEWNVEGCVCELRQSCRANELLRRPQVGIDDILKTMGLEIRDRELRLGIEADVKYEGFTRKQKAEVERFRLQENEALPHDIDYASISGLLTESREKLGRIRPCSFGQASRIPGITPADISALIIYLSKHKSRETARGN